MTRQQASQDALQHSIRADGWRNGGVARAFSVLNRTKNPK